jgi:phosphoribosylamine--glycine ligase/phosphoribosylformylglycinamidine cyclo-ligase
LIGGETAEMPGLFVDETYDAVGAAVGAINTTGKNAKSILPATSAMQAGDVLLALASSGPHSNGYSLVRKIVERSGLGYNDPAPFTMPFSSSESLTLGRALLTPTRIYVKPILKALSIPPSNSASGSSAIKGLAHITGGGLVENVPRMLPSTLSAHINASAWQLPPVFSWLKKNGNVTATEMARAFNCGVGMVIVAEKGSEAAVKELFEKEGEVVYQVGELKPRQDGEEGCVLEGLQTWDA